MAAAGLWTTPSDLALWGISLMKSYRGETGGVLSPTMAREMLRPQTALPNTRVWPPPGTWWWGLGVAVTGSGRDFSFTHVGRDEGFTASLRFFPERDAGIVIMTNATNIAFFDELTQAFTEEFLK